MFGLFDSFRKKLTDLTTPPPLSPFKQQLKAALLEHAAVVATTTTSLMRQSCDYQDLIHAKEDDPLTLLKTLLKIKWGIWRIVHITPAGEAAIEQIVIQKILDILSQVTDFDKLADLRHDIKAIYQSYQSSRLPHAEWNAIRTSHSQLDQAIVKHMKSFADIPQIKHDLEHFLFEVRPFLYRYDRRHFFHIENMVQEEREFCNALLAMETEDQQSQALTKHLSAAEDNCRRYSTANEIWFNKIFIFWQQLSVEHRFTETTWRVKSAGKGK